MKIFIQVFSQVFSKKLKRMCKLENKHKTKNFLFADISHVHVIDTLNCCK